MPTPASSRLERQYFLDWLRILAFGLLVVYHAGMYYVPWDWHIKSAHAGSDLVPWMRLVSPWRMDLIFLVSGAATSFMLWRRGTAGGLLGERSARLLLPLVFGMLVIVPPQSYLEVVHRYAYAGSYFDFMRLYLSGYGGFCDTAGRCLTLPTWNHLWYLPYLFTYTLMLWGLLRLRPQLLDRLAGKFGSVLDKARLLMWPILFLALTRIALRDSFPVTHNLVNDWFMHTQYFAMFLFGAVLARTAELPLRMQRLRWCALACVLAAWATLLVIPTEGVWITAVARPVFFSIVQWCAIVAAMGFARRHLGFDGPWRRYLTEAVFPVYILHQTLTIMLAHAMRPWNLAPVIEGVLLVCGTFLFSFLAFECVRRVGWLRPVFGLRRGRGGRDSARHAAV